MKKYFIILTGMILSTGLLPAQNDTMYIMRNGVVMTKYSASYIDSIVFYQPVDATVSDADGNVYNIVNIGDQVWITENLKTTRYNDSTAIPLVTDNAAWAALNTPAYCWYQNDSTAYSNPYGALYSGYAVNTGKLCPAGWHVPTSSEWQNLIDFLGGNSVAGGKLKEIGTDYWTNPNKEATNETGFTALAGSYRMATGTFSGTLYDYGYWWSSSEVDASNARGYMMGYNWGAVQISNGLKQLGYSIRCIRD